jgi:hypothetical protein
MQSEGTVIMFSRRISTIVVSGDEKVWKLARGTLRAAASEPVHGGRHVQ